jgi:hypothetical protein
LAIVDGEDFPAPIKRGLYVVLPRETDGSEFPAPLPMAMPVELKWMGESLPGGRETVCCGITQQSVAHESRLTVSRRPSSSNAF